MAYRRSISARAKLFYQHPRVIAPSFSHVHGCSDDDHENRGHISPISKNHPPVLNYFKNSLLGTAYGMSSRHESRGLFQDRKFAIPAACGLVFARNMSSIGEGSGDKAEMMSDVLGDGAVEVASQVGPVVNEVAVAAADSFFPVAALQYLIDYVHSYTGLNWWASIIVTTLVIRWIQLPALMINHRQSTSKSALLMPRLEEIMEEVKNMNMSPAAVAEAQARMQELSNEYGISTPLNGILITAPIFCCFFFALRNMAENVPSFKEGGALWFTDLTTPDSMYIFPVLTALAFCIRVERNVNGGLENYPSAGAFKIVCRVFAVLTIPLTATFPKAIFCYWITSSLFSLAYGLVLERPEVKKFLGVPIIPVTPQTAKDRKPRLSLFDFLKKYAAGQQQQSPASPPEASPKPTNQRVPSSSVLSQRIKSSEKEVKGRKKGKKR